MVNDNLLLQAARAKAAAIRLDDACLEHLRSVIATQHQAKVIVVDDLTGHGIWLQTSPGGTIVFTGPTRQQQLHELAHLALGHQPQPASSSDVVHGRATNGAIDVFSAEQEVEARAMSQALAERLQP
ncbi:hypothetical protein [Catelliglobosispora koreensis]|uniref:hypothetical protein n=1 Tax=Catelliglobosispora koreensis TaxID=129052 RepID=UPI0003696AE6|nr:hypothetical protein [Catelliglobosispora koreensis]